MTKNTILLQLLKNPNQHLNKLNFVSTHSEFVADKLVREAELANTPTNAKSFFAGSMMAEESCIFVGFRCFCFSIRFSRFTVNNKDGKFGWKFYEEQTKFCQMKSNCGRKTSITILPSIDALPASLNLSPVEKTKDEPLSVQNFPFQPICNKTAG